MNIFQTLFSTLRSSKARGSAFLLIAAATCCATLTACHHKHSHDHHDHEGIMLTTYSDDYEFFAEISPLIAGQEAELLCHVTRLADFKPLEGGELCAVLESGGAVVESENAEMEKPGIFHLALSPQKEGAAKLTLRLKENGKETIAEFDNLRVFADEEDAEEDAESREVTGANTVVFPKEMSWAIDFSTVPVAQQPLGNVIRTVAQVLPSQDDETLLVAKASGIVTLAGAALTEGTSISNGQAICRIDASATATDNLAAAQQQSLAEYERAKAEYERLKTLRGERLALESELAAAKAAYETAEATWKALQKGFNNGSQTVTASRAGFLKQLSVKNGQFVQAGETLAVITQSRTLQLKAEVPSSSFPDLKNIAGANIKTKTGAYTLEELGGRMLSYGRQVETNSPLIPVVFEIKNVLDLLPGTFVDTYILTRSNEDKMCVPSEGVIEEMGNYFVFVQLTPELFEKRQVKIGASDGILTEISSGVAFGERVVGKGAISLKLQQAAGGLDPHAGHNH